jgi:hypothetical protein
MVICNSSHYALLIIALSSKNYGRRKNVRFLHGGQCLDPQRKLLSECPRRDIQQMAENFETVAS